MNSLDLNTEPYINEIHKGLLEDGYFLLKKIHLFVGKKNKPFIRLLLADKTGHLPGIYFNNKAELDKVLNEVQEGNIIRISGIVEEYQGVVQINLIKIAQESQKGKDLSRFWKRTPHDRRLLYSKLKSQLKELKNIDLKELCTHFLKDKAYMKLFLDAPASRAVHHAYIGGLIEHTYNVMQLVKSYATIYENADSDLLIAGAFLHDVGKVDEYQYLFQIDHSSEGKLKGHTLLGYERVQEKIRLMKFTGNIRLKLEHIILSHQGKRHWGAIEEPRFLEAYLVHAADSTDSSQFIYSNAKRKIDNSNPYWSEYIATLGRDIFLG